MELQFPVVEIFQSLQGEGTQTGRPCTFLRLGGCNLSCSWCDTDWMTSRPMRLPDIVHAVQRLACKNLIITGGEPLIHPQLTSLLAEFKREGYWLAVETNATRALTAEQAALVDYVAASPKAAFALQYVPDQMVRKANEVRIPVDGRIEPFCREMRHLIQADRYYLSPCEQNGIFTIEETIRLLARLNEKLPSSAAWGLSLQTHKLAGFR